MKQSLPNDYHNGSQNRNPPHTTADLKQKSSCLHLESETPLSFYNNFIVYQGGTYIRGWQYVFAFPIACLYGTGTDTDLMNQMTGFS